MHALLLLPIVSGVVAMTTGELGFKLAVPGLCGLILWVVHRRRTEKDYWWVVLAFGFSMVGDSFLSNRGDDTMLFIYGIGGFFIAHLGYLGFARATGSVHWGALGILVAVYVPFYIWSLNPAIDAQVLSIAVLVYLLISVLVLATAIGSRLDRLPRMAYIAGIALIVISDTFIAFNEFLGWTSWGDWVLPTYYAAHIVITAGLIRRAVGDRQPA